jgi:aminoglycoside phosphotransferase (APT) family kinase protein
MTIVQQDPPGLDLARLGVWFADSLPGAGSSLTAELIAGGRSNLTFVVTDGVGEWIVRRPPVGTLLATAHDMGREQRVMSALQGTGVPVPRIDAYCADTSVVGAEFYVMERVAGRPYRFAAELTALGAQRTRAISESLVDVLAALHAVSPDEVGLGDFGRPEGFLGRQVARWRKQLDASHTRDLPAADELHRRLAVSVPAESATGIVHGDFRLDNVLIDDADRPAAVIDWEMATLGDPLTDLALMLVYGRMDKEVAGDTVLDGPQAPGYLAEDEIVARYAATSDRDLSGFGWYLGLAAFKLAGILEGIHYRYLNGQTVGPGFESIGDAVVPLLESGLTAMQED